MKLVDAHLHFCDFNRLSELETYLGALRIEAAALISLPDRAEINFNPEVLFAKAAHPKNLYAFGELDYTKQDLAAQIPALHDAGFDGVKLIMGKPAFARIFGRRLDEAAFDKVIEAAAGFSMPMLIHLGDPMEFWAAASDEVVFGGARGRTWKYRDPEFGGEDPSFEDCLRLTFDLAERHASASIVFAHLAFLSHDLDRLDRLLDRHPKVFVDLAQGKFFLAELDERRDAARAFFARRAGRVLVGSDAFFFYPTYAELEYVDLYGNLERMTRLLTFLRTEEQIPNPFVPSFERRPLVRGLGLAPDIVETLSSATFRTVFPAPPRPLNHLAAAAYLDAFVAALDPAGRGAGIYGPESVASPQKRAGAIRDFARRLLASAPG